MKKNILGIKPILIFVFLIVLALALVFISVGWNRRALDNWNAPEALQEKWTGQSEVFAPFKKGISPSEFPEDWINIEIVIHADGTVSGMIGQAELVNCVVKQNRNWFERLIGIKTDTIIQGGYLKGPITHEDTVLEREISIPFNWTGDEINGSIFEIEAWKYPDPLFPRLTLNRAEE